jgi:hypothetical protein
VSGADQVRVEVGIGVGAESEAKAEHLGVAPPPGPDVMAAITAAAQLVWPRPAPPDEQDPVHQTWRFSGRWWNKPTPLRRDRPWARH